MASRGTGSPHRSGHQRRMPPSITALAGLDEQRYAIGPIGDLFGDLLGSALLPVTCMIISAR